MLHFPRVWTTGIGKSGIAALYLADLMASVDHPAAYVHATEALHGGLGRFQPGDVVLGFSASGTTAETREVLARARARDVLTVFVAGVFTQEAQDEISAGGFVIDTHVGPDDEYIGRLPTASFLAQVEFAIRFVSEVVGYAEVEVDELQARVHPGGYLGATA